jgi:WD40 repeat protein
VILLDLSSGRPRLLKRAGAAPDCTLIEAARGLALPLFLPDGRLISTGADHLRLWDLDDGSSRVVRPCEKGPIPLPVAATPDSRTVLLLSAGTDTTTGTWPTLVDLEAATLRQVTSHGSRFPATVRWATLDPTGRLLITGDQDGLVRVGALSGEGPPHLLFGHTRQVTSVAVSPDGRWIASGSDDGTIRLWPMPDLTRPPLHALPHDELLGRLRSFTNLRVVPDRGSASGYKVEAGPFPGWGEVPTW